MAVASPATNSGHAITTHAADAPPLSKHLPAGNRFRLAGARLVPTWIVRGATHRMGHAPFWSVLYCGPHPEVIGLLPARYCEGALSRSARNASTRSSAARVG